MNTKNLAKPAKQGAMDDAILQIPPTIISTAFSDRIQKTLRNPLDIKRIMNERVWLRPNGVNLDDMLYIVEKTKDRNYIEFMLHSSELMPGGSPTFKSKRSVERLYSDLNCLFSEIKKERRGITLSEYAVLYGKESEQN